MYYYEDFFIITLLVFGVVGLGICYACGRFTESLISNKGYDNPKMYFWLGFFTGVIGIVIAALLPDKTPDVNVIRNTISELKQYKDLLDAGVITETEFEIKKRELLRR